MQDSHAKAHEHLDTLKIGLLNRLLFTLYYFDRQRPETKELPIIVNIG
jgi:hypothetical protein